MQASRVGHSQGGEHAFAAALACLASDLDMLSEYGPDELTTDNCEQALKDIERAARRLSALQTRMVGALAKRRIDTAQRAAEASGRPVGTAVGRARRAVEEFLSNELGMSPSDARGTTQDGQRRGQHRELDGARDTGDVAPRQARLVAEFLDKVTASGSAVLTAAQMDELEAEATAQARRDDPVELSRWLRRRLGQIDSRRAEFDESIRRRHRSVRATMGDDGMLHLSARLAGVDAGIVTQAMDLFRVPDRTDVPAGQRRLPEQVTADAFVQMCRVALEADHRSTRAGARPHVVVTIDYQTLLDQHGNAEIERVGPVPFREVRRLLSDAGVARMLVDRAGLPLEAGPEVRSVPAGLRRVLVERDRGCVVAGCSIPARWCQVAHLDEPYRFEGRLSPQNAALMCHQHHTRFDLHGWRIRWLGKRPELVPPSASPGTKDVQVQAASSFGVLGTGGDSPPVVRPDGVHDGPPLPARGAGLARPAGAVEPSRSARGAEPPRPAGAEGAPPIAASQDGLAVMADQECLPFLSGESRGVWRVHRTADRQPHGRQPVALACREGFTSAAR